MASLITSTQKTVIQQALSDVHDTFLIDGTKVNNEDIKMTFK